MALLDRPHLHNHAPGEDFSWMVDARGHHFRVHTRAYTDAAVFDAEMERIFKQTWVYVAHTSELPEPGDYRTSYIGNQPVIVSRSDDGAIHVLVNRCVHRGSVVCREARGHAVRFVCPYHGWAYEISGKLTGITDRSVAGGYAQDFDAPEGLHRVARVDVYRGFIFASFDPDVPPLLEHLGKAKDLIDLKLDMSPVGEIRLRSTPYVVRYQGNWKFQAENIVDQYHFMFVHSPFARLQAKYGDSTGDFGVHKGGSHAEMRNIRYQGTTWGCQYGHGISFQPKSDTSGLLDGQFAELYAGIRDRHGEDGLARIGGKGAGSIFPNLGIIHHQIRTWRPLAPDLTEVTVYPYELVGAPDELNEGMLRSQERFYGPAGYGMPDDVDIFMQNTEGLRGSAVEWLILERGIDSDEHCADGDYRGLPTSEACQRGLWRRWSALMQG